MRGPWGPVRRQAPVRVTSGIQATGHQTHPPLPSLPFVPDSEISFPRNHLHPAGYPSATLKTPVGQRTLVQEIMLHLYKVTSHRLFKRHLRSHSWCPKAATVLVAIEIICQPAVRLARAVLWLSEMIECQPGTLGGRGALPADFYFIVFLVLKGRDFPSYLAAVVNCTT